MKALIISGGGSKGAFAGGVAQYLIEEQHRDYDLYLGTSTGGLLITHLALQKIEKIKHIYTHVNQKNIFDSCPFLIQKKRGISYIKINHFNVLKSFLRGRKTFGESNNLRELIRKEITHEEFSTLRQSNKEIIVTVSNLSTNKVEFKSLKEYNYEDFLDWVWISCNYVPFMTLAVKNRSEYADGGLGSVIPIEAAIKRGATEIDAIVLDTEIQRFNRMHSRNAFHVMGSVFRFMGDRIEYQNIKVGKLLAQQKNVKLNLYYTPVVLTTNALIFDKEKMQNWWKSGWKFAQRQFKKGE